LKNFTYAPDPSRPKPPNFEERILNNYIDP